MSQVNAGMRRESNLTVRPSAGTIAPMTFVVRFWREWTGTEVRWRGRVEHVESSLHASFLDIGDLLGFFKRFGVGGAGHSAGRSEEPAEPAAQRWA